MNKKYINIFFLFYSINGSLGVFDFSVEVTGKVGVFWEGVKIEVSEYVLGLFEYRVEVVECKMLYDKEYYCVENYKYNTNADKRVGVYMEFVLILLIDLLINLITNFNDLVYILYYLSYIIIYHPVIYH